MNDTQLIDDLRAQMDTWTSSDEPDLAALLAPQRRRPSRTLWAAGGVTATASAAAAAVLLAQAGAPARTAVAPARAATPSGTDASIKAAIRTGPESMPVFDDDERLSAAQWFSVSSVQFTLGQGKPQDRTIWFGRDGSSVVDESGNTGPGEDGISVGAQTLSWSQLQQLPTDPKALAAAVIEPGARSAADRLAKGVASVLEESPADLLLRKALVKVVESIPSAHVDQNVMDSRSRASFAVTYVDDTGITHRLDIDPVTYRVLEDRWRATAVPNDDGGGGASVPAGTLLVQTTYTAWGYSAPPGR